MQYEIIMVIGLVLCGLAAIYLRGFRQAFLVPEGYAGLLYHKGKFVGLLGPGRHIRWGRYYHIVTQDTRKGLLAVPGQEVLTADNVGLKLSLMVTYQVTEPIKAAHETQHWNTDLYNQAQIALRGVISGIAAEALLSSRLDVSGQLIARVQPEAAKIGITVHAIEVKDVMLPGELKRAFAEVLKARQEGQAALERARGETAALRNLANAARLMEGNPALMNLRLMQSVSAAQGSGSTLVLGVPAGFVPLKNGRATPGPATDTAGE